MAPHGTGDGLLGVAALVQMSAALPSNFIAFEYCGSLEDPATGRQGQPVWWKDILDGLPDPIVKDGFIDVWDAPVNHDRLRVATANLAHRLLCFRGSA